MSPICVPIVGVMLGVAICALIPAWRGSRADPWRRAVANWTVIVFLSIGAILITHPVDRPDGWPPRGFWWLPVGGFAVMAITGHVVACLRNRSWSRALRVACGATWMAFAPAILLWMSGAPLA